jgi:hypothetical protein
LSQSRQDSHGRAIAGVPGALAVTDCPWLVGLVAAVIAIGSGLDEWRIRITELAKTALPRLLYDTTAGTAEAPRA